MERIVMACSSAPTANGWSRRVKRTISWKSAHGARGGEIEGSFTSFSHDGYYGAVWDQNDTLCLLEIATGRILARLERPDQQRRGWVAFSPDQFAHRHDKQRSALHAGD